MPNHHPTPNTLLEHAAGTQSWSLSVAVSAHLQMCNACRQEVHELNHIGGVLLEAAPADVPHASSLQQVMARIEAAERDEAARSRWGEKQPSKADSPPGKPELLSRNDVPAVLRRLLPRDRPLVWRRLSSSVQAVELGVLDGRDEVALYQVAPGSRFRPPHQGAEVALVLAGSFSDRKGLYTPGDFLVSRAEERVASLDQPCLYFSVTRAAEAWRSLSPGGLLASLKRYVSGVTIH